MLTIHAADAVLTSGEDLGEDLGTAPDAVAVDTGLIVAIGPYAELTAERPSARVRRWPGLLLPGLRAPDAARLLEAAYHPDPREADALGTEPVTGAALAALGLDGTGWGGSARRGLQRLLAHGCTAVVGPFTRPSVRTAVTRSGLRVREPGAGPGAGPGGTPALDPLSAYPLDALLDGGLTIGGPADFAVFDVPLDEPPVHALARRGASSCVATVLGGRLLHRRS
ncbi:hypothetical protein GCM10010387_53960 [Streptomyces inusitatus]|uniref:Uncharacterized protein n=1 Tax=Streptomyces inusitatus TaxID=68221 RepID=A0A918QJI0_9ACTN|nr:hypothetical protein [Streptomyces inusitatus]GGZ52998.1 hypothetical protein GCM10010387_53960 [Streptomyces inusitatus]